ncbi:MAG TPA: DedA family protein [Candidatus Acidoferrum sp.]|nr:DedA family protein [Candidatus Acidoferrum sp.]
MPDLSGLITHWGYFAIFLFVVLGNVGLPVPEESILILAGYLVWRQDLRLPVVLCVGVFSAMAGDNLGYWLGRRYGQPAIQAYGRWILVTSERFEAARGYVARHGAVGVFAARFIPGLRFLAGPLAGATGLRPTLFVVANALGAMIYVPTMVGLGYAVGYGLGDYVQRLQQVVGRIEHVVLVVAILSTLTLLGWRALRASREKHGP